MEKNRFEFSKPSDKQIALFGQVIKYRPFLTTSDIVEIIGDYVENYFHPTEKIGSYPYDILGSELRMRLTILNRCTDILIADQDGNVFVDLDFVMSDEVEKFIRNEISNFGFLEEAIEKAVKDVMYRESIENSLGYAIEILIDKATSFFETASNANLSEDTIKQISSVAKELKDSVSGTTLPVAVEQVKKSNRGRKKKTA